MKWKAPKRRARGQSGVTLIAPQTRICGDVHFHEQLFVNGRIEGDLTADTQSNAIVVISELGSVAGDINVPNVIVHGTVEGDVRASGKVELTNRARVKGNVYYDLIELQLGALVEGQLFHEAEAAEGAAEVHDLRADASVENVAGS